MSNNTRDRLLDGIIAYADGNIALHTSNVEVYLSNPAGIGEHPGVTQAIISELEKINKFEELKKSAKEF